MARVVCVLVLLLSGCADADRPPPSPPGDSTGNVIPRDEVARGDPKNVIAVGSCEGDAVIECRFYSKANGNVQSCFVGEQRCVAGTWGDCGDVVEVDAADLEDDDSSEDEPSSSGNGY